jgi:hypothetical protein
MRAIQSLCDDEGVEKAEEDSGRSEDRIKGRLWTAASSEVTCCRTRSTKFIEEQ